MALTFSRIREESLIGLDLRTPENRIPGGYLRDALNAEVVQGLARKRPGYAGYAGNMPVRVVEVEYREAENEICFTLDADVANASIDLLTARSSPLVVQGRLSGNIGAGPFTTADAAKYYNGWFQEIRKTFLTGTNTLTIDGTSHGLSTADLFVQVSEATSPVTLDNKLIEWDNINIDEATADVDIDYTNGTGSDKSVFVYLADQSPVAGTSYVSPVVNIGGGSTVTTTVPAAAHQLANFNVVARVYRDNGVTRDIVTPDALTVNTTTGAVQWTISNNTGIAADYFVILAAAPSTNVKQGSLSGSTYTITLSAPASPFIFPGIYVSNGVLLEQVIADEVEYDSVADTIKLTFENPGSDAFTVYWIDGQIRSTQICVTDTTLTASGTDTRPQLTLWGLDHAEIYSSTAPQRAGWVFHIDSYRVAGDSRIVAGLGGVLYAARDYSESATVYLYGQAYPSLFGRVASLHKLAPPFWETGETPQRTRGYITGTGLGEGAATCVAVDWDSGLSAVRYEITIPSLSMFTSTGAVETDVNDIFTIGDLMEADSMPYSRHNGTFTVVQVARSGNTLEVWADNPLVDGPDWDDAGCAGNVRITTDLITLQSDSPFLANDTIQGDAIVESQQIICVNSTAAVLRVSGVVDVLTLQAGVQLTGVRTSDVIPLRLVDDTASTLNFVRGDILEYSAQPNRPLRISYVNPLADVSSCSITGDGTTATLVLGSGDTEHLSIGMRVLIEQAGAYSGIATITNIPGLTSFEFESEETASESGVLLRGHTVHIGEPIEWADTTSDSNTLTVARRMLPIEAPDDSYALTPSTRPLYFDAQSSTEQLPLRSTLISDNLYLTNGQDEVMKFDGVNLYRAGLPRWQPGAFIQTDTTTGSIPVLTRSLTILATTTAAEFANGQGRYTAGSDTVPVGSTVIVTQGSISVTAKVTAYTAVTSPSAISYIEFDSPLTTLTPGSTAAVSLTTIYRYSYRLHMVDANNNVIASAVAQSEDYTAILTQACQIRHKVVGLPPLDNYDYDRLYFQAYRTLADAAAPFYLVYQTRLPFSGNDGYIEFTDSFSDENIEPNLETINLPGGSAANREEPVRAKYLTSAANSLVLANLRDYPQLDVQFRGNDQTTATGFNGTILTFLRDLTDPGTTTDMTNRVRYQFVDGTTNQTISSITGTLGSNFVVTTSAVHGLVDGDWVYIYWPTASTPSLSARPITYSGWWQVDSLTATTFRVNYTGSGSGVPATFPTRLVTATAKKDVPVLLGSSSNPDGNNSSANANTDVPLFQAGRRLALAINASMRMVDTGLSGYSTFTPWITAIGGNDTGAAGRLLVRRTRTEETVFGVSTTALGLGYALFLNEVQYAQGNTVSSTEKLFPSRIIISHDSFPEIFDAPASAFDFQSVSAVDVNPSDGQEITGVIPFFGESAFGAAQQSGVVVVFKEESIYLVDVAQKRAGASAVQRIETEGIGCTAPGSIAVTRGGIMFANQAGVYILTRDMKVEYQGWSVERKWLRSVNRDQLDLVAGHHFSTGKQYKLSVPVGTDESNSEVLVYDHSGETAQVPAGWTRYDNHPATGWCNLGRQSFFGATTGRVFVIRDSGEEWDYQDDNSGYTFQLQLRANDFGLIGARKVFGDINIAYRSEFSSSTQVATAVDTAQAYQPVTGVEIQATTRDLTGLGDASGQDVVTVLHSLATRKGVSLSVQISNSNVREAVEISGIEYRVGIYGDGQGVKQAVDTP